MKILYSFNKRGYEAGFWYGLLAPAGTAAQIVARLNGEIGRVLLLRDVIDKLSSQGVEPHFSTPEEFAARIRDEIPKWARVIKSAGVRLE